MEMGVLNVLSEKKKIEQRLEDAESARDRMRQDRDNFAASLEQVTNKLSKEEEKRRQHSNAEAGLRTEIRRVREDAHLQQERSTLQLRQ